MKVPPEFDAFCRAFHQDIHLVHPNLDDAIGAALASLDLNDGQKASLKSFLAELLDSSSDSDLEDVWNRSPSDWLFEHKESIRRFLADVLARL
jgi:hypothetical protein